MDSPTEIAENVQLGAWTGLITVSQLLPAILDSALQREVQMNHFEFTVLSRLCETPTGKIRMSALATKTNTTLPRLSHVITRMEKKNLVKRSPCPEDGRATNVAITQTGKEHQTKAAPIEESAAKTYLLQALSTKQLEELSEITKTITATLRGGTECTKAQDQADQDQADQD